MSDVSLQKLVIAISETEAKIQRLYAEYQAMGNEIIRLRGQVEGITRALELVQETSEAEEET